MYGAIDIINNFKVINVVVGVQVKVIDL